MPRSDRASLLRACGSALKTHELADQRVVAAVRAVAIFGGEAMVQPFLGLVKYKRNGPPEEAESQRTYGNQQCDRRPAPVGEVLKTVRHDISTRKRSNHSS